MLDAKYIAGFFDGEGWISVGSAGRKMENVTVGVCNCDRTIIEELRTQFPECTMSVRNEFGNARANYSIVWTGQKCIRFLTFIKNDLRIKREAACLAIELAKLQRPRGSKIDSETRLKRQELGMKIHLTPKRGA